MKTFRWVGVVCVALFGAGAVHAQELITNGSFENVTAGDIANWVQVGPATSELASTYGTSSLYGSRVLAFNANSVAPAGSATQDFATVSGQLYRVTFAYAQVGGAANDQTLTVTINITSAPVPQQLFTDATPTTDIATGWERGSFTFTGDGTAGGITFADTGVLAALANNSDLLVDDVSIVAIPEPATAALALVGLGVLGVTRRRR